jgi:SAM-dependent methyltransferase
MLACHRCSSQSGVGCAPATAFAQYDGARLPFADGTFRCAVASCVLHHVMSVARACFIGEMMTRLTPGGLAVIIEHNARNPVTHHIISRCAFDADAVLLTGDRHIARRWWDPGRRVGWLPAGAQYCVCGGASARTCEQRSKGQRTLHPRRDGCRPAFRLIRAKFCHDGADEHCKSGYMLKDIRSGSAI